MRTTVNLDEDIFFAIKSISEQKGKTIGQVLSELTRQALQPKKTRKLRNGVPLFQPKPQARPVTPELIRELEEDF